MFLKDSCRSGQLTGLQNVGQVLCLFNGHAATADGGTAIRNLAIDHREGIHIIVEDDGNLLADILAGETLPSLGTFGVHLDGDFHLVALAIVLTGIGNDFATEGALVVARHLQGNEVKHFDLFAILSVVCFRLHRPCQLEVARENTLGLG